MLPIVMALLALVTVSQDAQAFYNPSTGRWLSRDPINEPGFKGIIGSSAKPFKADEEKNLIAFVNNSPVYSIDLLGLAGQKRNPNNSQTVTVGTCEVVILVGHGGSGRPHTFTGPKGNCWAGGFIGCYAKETNDRIVANLIPGSPSWEEEIYDSDPEYPVAWKAIVSGAWGKAMAICKDAKCCCKEVTIVSLYAPSYDLSDLKRPSLPPDTKVKCK